MNRYVKGMLLVISFCTTNFLASVAVAEEVEGTTTYCNGCGNDSGGYQWWLHDEAGAAGRDGEGTSSSGGGSSGGDRGSRDECEINALESKVDCYNAVSDDASLLSATCNTSATVAGIVTAEFTVVIGGVVIAAAYGAYCYVLVDNYTDNANQSCENRYSTDKAMCS